jgi:hypothetical protein
MHCKVENEMPTMSAGSLGNQWLERAKNRWMYVCALGSQNSDRGLVSRSVTERDINVAQPGVRGLDERWEEVRCTTPEYDRK